MSRDIRVEPQDLESKSQEIRTCANKIQSAIDLVDAELNRMNAAEFSGQRADELRARYQQMRETLMSFCPMLNRFSQSLDETATRFRQADQANS